LDSIYSFRSWLRFFNAKSFSVVSVSEKLALPVSGQAELEHFRHPEPFGSGYPQQQKLLAKNEQSLKEQIEPK